MAHPNPPAMNDISLDDDDHHHQLQVEESFDSAGFVDGTSDDPRLSKGARNKWLTLVIVHKWLVALAVTVSIVAVVLIGVLASGGGGGSGGGSASSEAHAKPIRVDRGDVDPAKATSLLSKLVDAYGRHNIDASPVDDETLGDTHQRLALYWLATDPKLGELEHVELIQRYTLATLYYHTNHVAHHRATDPLPWKTAAGWLDHSAHSCDWQGVVCNSERRVIGLDLGHNNLSGSLPLELVFLGTTLEELDLSSNLIHVEGNGFDVLTGLNALHTLLVDDNFLVSKEGLPPQMHRLSNLRKLRASYNLLEGPMDPNDMVFREMSKLTHLELESNFFTGDIPTGLLNMPSLVYLYLRRNDMDLNLDFLRKGDFPNLFALWLDNNKSVQGSIPPQIGELKELASLSITNATITGSIPTEIGNLKGLRRLWLYENKLTGTIPSELTNAVDLEVFEVHGNPGLSGAVPQGVCQSVQRSEYAFKALTADCQSVSCGCCTKCY